MKKKVLIVDDHSDIRLLIRMTLGRDFEVLEADNGSAALSMVRSQGPQVVVLDVMMPGELDGFEVLDAIKRDPASRATRVIMVTARGKAQDREMGIVRGADEYFIKPFSPLQLANAIRALMK